ncbi:hypothetical protein GJ496_006128 [Pomphorhynchus laevis]|nr:hypothetical protein GJ496_006128 [Pomphorhynchus laevis]
MSRRNSSSAFKDNGQYQQTGNEYKSQIFTTTGIQQDQKNNLQSNFLNRTTGQSKVRRMARYLENNNNNKPVAFMNISSRESYNIVQPRSLDQLARFSSMSDLPHHFYNKPINGQGDNEKLNRMNKQNIDGRDHNEKSYGQSWFCYDNQQNHQNQNHAYKLLQDDNDSTISNDRIRRLSQSMNQLQISSNESLPSTLTPVRTSTDARYTAAEYISKRPRMQSRDEFDFAYYSKVTGNNELTMRKPCVIIKETIRTARSFDDNKHQKPLQYSQHRVAHTALPTTTEHHSTSFGVQDILATGIGKRENILEDNRPTMSRRLHQPEALEDYYSSSSTGLLMQQWRRREKQELSSSGQFNDACGFPCTGDVDQKPVITLDDLLLQSKKQDSNPLYQQISATEGATSKGQKDQCPQPLSTSSIINKLRAYVENRDRRISFCSGTDLQKQRSFEKQSPHDVFSFESGYMSDHYQAKFAEQSPSASVVGSRGMNFENLNLSRNNYKSFVDEDNNRSSNTDHDIDDVLIDDHNDGLNSIQQQQNQTDKIIDSINNSRVDQHQHYRDYSPRSTGSSMASGGSAFSAPPSYPFYRKSIPEQNSDIRLHQKAFEKQISLDSSPDITIKNTRSDRRGSTLTGIGRDIFSSDSLPSFARHTESSKRRSKFINQSISIPENLNLAQAESIQQNQQSSGNLLDNVDVKSGLSLLQNKSSHRRKDSNPRNGGEDVEGPGNYTASKQYLNKSEPQMFHHIEEREPEGEYHILKKWCESLRKYENKSKNNNNFPSLSNYQRQQQKNNRDSFIANNNGTSPKFNENKDQVEVRKYPKIKERDKLNHTPQQYKYQENVLMPKNQDRFANRDGSVNVKIMISGFNNFALSKAVSMDTLASTGSDDSFCDKDETFRRLGNIKDGHVKKFGSTCTKFTTLDTVCEETGQGSQADVKRRLKKSIENDDFTDHRPTMSRYFSEANLSMQRQTLGNEATCSDILVCREQMPLRYKRDSWVKRYGTEESLNCINPINKFVELEPDSDPPFKRRIVVPRKDKLANDEYSFGEFLGRGKFGEVKKCIEKRGSKELAAKFVPVRSETDRGNVYNEIEVMNSLQHPRLLQLYEAFDCGKEIILIMELISGGELFERVIDDDFILTEMLCELYVRQICEGISFMHNQNFLHLDMKVSSNFKIKKYLLFFRKK